MKIIFLLALISPQFKGDNDNVLGVINALQKQYEVQHNQVKTETLLLEKTKDGSKMNIHKLKEEFSEKYAAEENVIIIGAGEHGIDGFVALNPIKGKSKFIWSGHQLPHSVASQLKILDVIVLPSYTLDAQQIKQIEKAEVQLIKTIGVPHNIKAADCTEDYLNAIKSGLIPESKEGYLITCLSGDAPDAQKNIKYYTKEEAYALGQQLAKIAKSQNLKLLVTNGPRTGQHDPKTREKLSFHEKGQDIDLVSKEFLKGVKEVGEEPIFNNFVFGEPSLFNAYIGAALKNKQSIIVIGGESSSQVTQALNLLPGRVYIKTNNAMNDIHYRHIQNILNAENGKLLEKDSSSLFPYEVPNTLPADAAKVAEEFIEKIDATFNNQKGNTVENFSQNTDNLGKISFLKKYS